MNNVHHKFQKPREKKFTVQQNTQKTKHTNTKQKQTLNKTIKKEKEMPSQQRQNKILTH